MEVVCKMSKVYITLAVTQWRKHPMMKVELWFLFSVKRENTETPNIVQFIEVADISEKRENGRHRTLCRESWFMRPLLGMKMPIKRTVMTMLLQLVKTEVIWLPKFRMWE